MSNLIIKIFVFSAFLITACILVIITQVLLTMLGKKENFANPNHQPVIFGNSENDKIKYLIMGDSTTAGQGGDYTKGIAYSTSKHLTKNYYVEMVNISVSGATSDDVVNDQLKEGLKTNPDIVLLSVGANDVTHLTQLSTIEKNLIQIIESLQKNNCKVKIVVTAAPDMGVVIRLPQPLRAIAGLRSNQVNKVFYKSIEKYNLTLAPIADVAGPIFKNDPTHFAKDNFHPNDKGYGVWSEIINSAIDKSLEDKSDGC